MSADDLIRRATTLAEEFDTQMDVEANPCGAWMAIQELHQAIAALPAVAPGVRVKPLVWEQISDRTLEASGAGSVYRIQTDVTGAVRWQSRYMGEWHDASSVDVAKDAAQMSHETSLSEFVCLAALPAVAPGVRVKPLEWEEEPDRDPNYPKWTADTGMGKHYFVFKAWWGSQQKWGFAGVDGFYHTKDEAKAAAQADYEARILAALDTPAPAMGELVEALRPLAVIADAFDKNELDDEARKHWAYGTNETPHDQIELYQGRGGKLLLTLADCMTARAVIAKLDAKP
jgi:hypothetical protein